MDHEHWYAVGRYHFNGPMGLVIENMERHGDVLDVDEETGHVMFSIDRPFLSTAKNMGELRGDARHALSRIQRGDAPVEVINVTRAADMKVFEFDF